MKRILRILNPFRSNQTFKYLRNSKPTKTYVLILGTAATAAIVLHNLKKRKARGENPLNSGYFRQKHEVAPYSRVLEEVQRRDFEHDAILASKGRKTDAETLETRARIEKLVRRVQHNAVVALSTIENKPFDEDEWLRADGRGGGVVRHIQDGNHIEKGGVNISISEGELNREAQQHMINKRGEIGEFLESKNGAKVPFYAASISSVIHPKNPHAPTVHFNYRYFELGDIDEKGEFVAKHWWVGGGCDLSPSILYSEDCEHFHSVYKKACDKFGKGMYAAFKKQCDDYFVIPYRREHRGVGGIFFDGLQGDKSSVLSFVEQLADAFFEAYIPILFKRCTIKYTEEEKRWQEVRRGRYAEFNFTTDRGTMFGRSREHANIEAIHISLPLKARFEYKASPKNAEQRKLVEVLERPVDWIPLN